MYLLRRSSTFFSAFQKFKAPIANNAGFTLAEMMMVLAIIAISAAVAGPAALEWNRNKQLSGSARNMFANFQLAKLEAIKNNCSAVVSFTLPDRYEVFLDNGGPTELGTSDNEAREGDEVVVLTESIPNGIAIEIADFDGNTFSGFTSRGLPIPDLTGNVVFRRAGNTDRWYRVVLAPSGQLTFQKSTDSSDGKDGTWK